MQKKSKGIIFLGVLFILFGVIFSGIGIFVFAESGWEKVVPKIIDSGVAKTLEGMKTFLAEKEQVKLKASGKLDQFKIEYDSFRQELVRLAEEYKAKLPQINRLFAGIYLLAGIFSLIAGIGLIAHKNWGRNISYSSILSICCSYVFFWYVIYPMGFMMNFITDRANALYLLIDPLDPAYRVLS